MRGFTLIELLIVVALALILAVAAIPIYGFLPEQTQLGETSAQIAQTLRIARQNSVVGLNDSAQGVYFEINSEPVQAYILYQGPSYSERQADYDRRMELPAFLTMANSGFVLNNAGDIEINFSQGLGRPDNIGSLILAHRAHGEAIISVNELGRVEEY